MRPELLASSEASQDPEASRAGKTRRPRLFWCHPMLMDYRLGLFRRMADRYDVRFFFQQRSAIPNPFESVYGRDDVIRLDPPPQDIREIRRGVRWADVFVSSFVFSPHTQAGLRFAKLRGRKVIVWEEINDQTLFEVRRRDVRYGFRGFSRAFAGTEGPEAWTNWKKVAKFRMLARFIDAFFVQGRSQAEALVRLGVDPARVFRSNEYPGQDYGDVPPRPIPLPVPGSARVLLYLGRLIEIKGVDYLIRAFARLAADHADVSLLIVGDGPERPRLEELSRSFGLSSVHFLGWVNDVGEKSFLFRRADAVVVPSITIHGAREGGPLVVLEALSAGTPVVGTNVLGSSTSFVRESVNGYVVPEKDPEALHTALERVLGEGRIARESVLRSFREILGHDHQAEQLSKAVTFVTRGAKFG